MDTFKQQLQRIQEQLGGLTGSQRTLVIALVTIMVLTLMFWSRYSAAPDRIALLPQAVRDQDQVKIDSALTARGIAHTSTGGTIMVSPDDRLRALAVLTTENLLPGNTTHLLDDLFNSGNMFDTHEKSTQRYQYFLSEKVRQMLMMGENVVDASVTIDNTNLPRFGNSVLPTAAVFIKTDSPGSRISRKRAQGFVNLLVGTVAGMKRANVQLVVDDQPYSIDDSMAGGDLLENQSSSDKYYTEQLTLALSYIPGVRCVVSTKINNETRQTKLETYDDIKSKEVQITSKSSESTQPGMASADPAVGANTGASMSVAPAGGSTTTEESSTTMQNFPTHREEQTTHAGGQSTVTSAVVAVPRSYFVNTLKSLDPSGKEPEMAAVDARIAAERETILQFAASSIGMTDIANIKVTTFVDSATASAAPLGKAGAAGGSIALLSGNYVKEIVIGLLAAASLFMLSMIVRKGTPAPLVMPETDTGPRDFEEIDGNEAMIGIATIGNQAMDAVELGGDDIQNQQMVDQVSNLVKENPDSAAMLVKRWLNRA